MFGEDEFDGGGGAAALPPVSVGAGDMGNAARPNPQAPPVAQALPDISGMWRTTTGEVYHFDQDGTRVSFIAEAGGQDLGQGSGSFDGVTLRLALTLRVQGVVMGNANCDLQAGPQHESFAGMCMGPNGPFMAQMFR